MPSNNNRINFQVGYNVDQASVNAVKKSLQDLQNIKIKDFNGPKKQLDQIKETAGKVQAALQKAFNVNLGSLNIKSFNDQLKTAGLSVNQIYSQFSKAGAVGTNAFRNMASSILTTNLQLKQTKSLISSMGETLTNTVKWGIASSVMNSFTNSVQQAFQYAKSLDAALTDIRIVTGDSTDKMRQFAKEANNAAQSLGRSTMDYTKAALTFYQQGLNEEQVKTRTETVLKAQNITGAGQEMADYLTAVWNGYKVANEEAELYVDKLAAVADSSASNMSQLAVAMSKVASTANALGVPVDSLNAQIATIVATTRQAPESVGNALKTIYARMNDIKTGADDAEISLGNYSGIMAKLGFNVLDANGNLRDTGDTLDEIGAKWQTLSRQQQIYLARTMAGQRQYNNLIALFDNWGKYSDLLNVSMESQGTTMQKNSRYMESLGAKLEQLGAAGQRVKDALISEDDLKGIVSFGSNITNLFGSFIEGIGGSRGALLGLTGVLTSVFGPAISKELSAAINNFEQARNNAQKLKQQINDTRELGLSKGYESGIIKEMVDSKKQIQQYYSSMSAAQIQSYDNIIREIGAHQNLRDSIKEEQNQLQKFNNSVAQTGQAFGNNFNTQVEVALEVIEDLENELQELSLQDLQDPQIFSELVVQIRELQGTVGQDAVPAFEKFENILNTINSQSSPATINQLAQLRAMANAALNQTNNLLGKDIDEVKAKANEAQSSLSKLRQAREQALSQAKNNAFSQNLTAYISSLTQIMSIINNIYRISSIWQDESLSHGEKIRQILTTGIFSVGMLVNSLSQISKTMGVQNLLADKRFLTEHKITLEKQKQAALDKYNNINNLFYQNKASIQQVQTAYNSLQKITGELKVTENALSNVGSVGGLVFSKITTGIQGIIGVLSGPAGLVALAIAAAGAIGYTLYKAYTKEAEAAKQALQIAQQSKKAYNDISNSIKDLNSSLDSLKSARDSLNDLTKGTTEWNSALQDVNNQVLSLIDKYPQLKGLIRSDSNGALYLDQSGTETILNSMQNQASVSALAYAGLDRKSTQATNVSLITDFTRNINDGSFLGGVTREEVQSVVNAINQHGEWILRNEQTLQRNTDIQLKNITALYENGSQLNSLAKQVQSNIVASESLTTALTQSALTGTKGYQEAYDKQLYSILFNRKVSNFSPTFDEDDNINLDTFLSQYTQYIDKELQESFDRTEPNYKKFGQIIESYVPDWNKLGQIWEQISSDYSYDEAKKTFYRLNEENKKETVKLQQAVQEVINQILLNDQELNQVILQEMKKFGEENANIIKAFRDNGTVNLNELSKNDLNSLYQTNNQDLIDFVIQQLGLQDEQEFRSRIAQYWADQGHTIYEYIKALPKSVQEAFKQIDNKDDLTIQAYQTIGSILQKAFVEGKGLQGLEQDVAKLFDEALSKNKLDQLLNLDFANLELQDLQDILNDLGLTSEDAEVGLKALIRTLKQGLTEESLTPEEIYNNIHSVIDKKNGKTLKQYEEISDQDYNKLKIAGVEVEGAFVQMTSGAWKFIGDAEEFYKRANQVSLDPFISRVKELQEQIDKTKDLSFQQLSKNAITEKVQNEDSRRSKQVTEIDKQLAYNQVNTLSSLGLLNETKQAEYNALIEDENANLEEQKTALLEIQELLIQNREQVEQYLKTQKQQTAEQEHQAELQLAFSQQDLGELMDLRNSEQNPLKNLNDDQYIEALIAVADAQGLVKENIIDLAQLWAQSASEIDGVNDSLQDNEKASYDVAAAAEDLISGIESIQKAWKDTIKDGIEPGIQELSAAREAISDMFNQDVSSTFVQDHLDEIRRIAQGDITAVQELGNELAFLTMQSIQVPTYLNKDQFDADLFSLQDQINNTDFGEIQIGTNIDEAPFYDALQRLVIESGMTQQQINNILAGIGYSPMIEYVPVTLSKVEGAGTEATYEATGELADGTPFKQVVSQEFFDQNAQNTSLTIPVIKGSKYTGGFHLGSVGGGRVTGTTPKTSGGSGRGGGGKGSSPKTSTPKKATQQKPQNLSEDKETIEDRSDVYHDVNLALEKQEDKLDDIQRKQKKLVNRDRLKNLEQQNKQLEKQKSLLDWKSEIAASELVSLKNEIIDKLGNAIKFDSNGQIANYNAALEKAKDNYNAAIIDYNKKVHDAEIAYNKYVDQYNAMSGQAQQANKQNLDKQKDLMEAAKKAAQKTLDSEKDKYDVIKDSIKQYEETLELQREIAKQQQQIEEQKFDNLIAMSKIKVDLAIDTGDFERDWLDFENKFIKKLDKDDFLGSAKASAKELMSYFNSDQVQQTANQIGKIRNYIDIMNSGGASNIYGTNLAQAKEDLEDYMSQQMKDLQEVQDMVDNLKDNYLDAIDDASDKMDDQIDQYERVNDLINHNVKLVELLYGDKAYDSMQKYYGLQKANNERELESLKKQQDYWQQKMNNELVGSDAWKKFKDNLDNVTDNLNDKLEDMIDNLADQFENRVNGIIARLNNAMTNGRGLDFLDEQWDYINNYDDQFLDTFETKMGIDEVERLYQSTIDGIVGSPKSQQALNKLMTDQLKLLRQKDHLTKYDLQRDKASLEVQKARLALEEARDNKTKMRLRRDSQGNYTYQYVADEQKLGELQSALADAQANLYNTDKQHYKQNLNNLYDAYKDYIEKMKDLTEEYNKTQDEEERKRIQNRIDLLKDSTAKLMSGLTEDNEYLLNYLNSSFFSGMGVDTTALTVEEQMQIMQQNIPQMQSQIQDLANTIVGQGGIIPATLDMMNEINQATQEYDQNVKNMLETAGTNLEAIESAIDGEGNALDKNIVNAQNLITANDELINSCRAQIEAIEELLDYMDQYLNKVMSVETLLANLRSAYNIGQNLNGSNLTADEIGMTGWGLDTTAGMQYTGNPKTDAAAIKQQIDALMLEYEKFLAAMSIATFDTGGYTGTWGDAEGRLAFLHQGELVLNQDDTRNILTAVQTVRAITGALNGVVNGELNSIMSNATGFLGGLNRTEQLDQNVHIEANFPNVTQHTEIEQAFENLVNMASMRASNYRD